MRSTVVSMSHSELPTLCLHPAHVDPLTGKAHSMSLQTGESVLADRSIRGAWSDSCRMTLEGNELVVHDDQEPALRVLLTLSDVCCITDNSSGFSLISMVTFPRTEDVLLCTLDPRGLVKWQSETEFDCCSCFRSGLVGDSWRCSRSHKHICSACLSVEIAPKMWILQVEGGQRSDVQRVLAVFSSRGAVRRDLHKEYKITMQAIGQGSYASVFLASARGNQPHFASLPSRDLSNLRESAKQPQHMVVKILHKKREDQARLLRQCGQLTFEIAALVATRGHPNVTALRGIFIDRDQPHLDAQSTGSRYAIVMDWHSSGDLSKLLAQRQAPLDEDRALEISRNVLAGLVHVHSFEIIHRDVKPENVFIAADGRAVLGDFGLACSVSDHDEASKLIGSPGCCAPETVMCERYDTKADVFGMGCVLYFMLSGRFPFFGRSIHSTLLKTVQCKLAFDCEYFGAVSHECMDYIASLLEKFPTSRPSSSEAHDQIPKLLQQEVEQPPDLHRIIKDAKKEDIDVASSDDETERGRRWRRRTSFALEGTSEAMEGGEATTHRSMAGHHIAHRPVDHSGVFDVSKALLIGSSGDGWNKAGVEQCNDNVDSMISKLSTDSQMCNISGDSRSPPSSQRNLQRSLAATLESGRHSSLAVTLESGRHSSLAESASPTYVCPKALPWGVCAPPPVLPAMPAVVPPPMSKKAPGPPSWLQRRRAPRA